MLLAKLFLGYKSNKKNSSTIGYPLVHRGGRPTFISNQENSVSSNLRLFDPKVFREIHSRALNPFTLHNYHRIIISQLMKSTMPFI